MMMREWVFRALTDVIRKKTYSNLYLKDHLQEVDEKDRALAANIFYGTLQNYDLCQYDWKRFTDDRVDPKTRILLSMSCYQLLFLDKVPDYAIINDAVKIAARMLPGQKNLVNAVLRKCANTPLTYPNDPIKALALKTSVAEWLIRLWIKQYSAQQAFKFAQASLAALPVVVRINPLKYSVEEAMKCPRLKELPNGLSKRSGLFEYRGTQIGTDWLYKEGKISVQDPGSFEIAQMVDIKPGMSVLDLCAAPGTKTMAMAEMAGNQADITALDLHEHRVKLIEQDARRLGLDHITARVQDASQVSEPVKQYDAVLCDVPCSGYGILSRKPDLKLRLNPEDIDSLLPIQKELLEAGAEQTKPGGVLVYSTCTLDTKENEKQVEKFLAAHPDFTKEEEKTIEPSKQNGGFYLCKMKRQA